MKRQAEVLEAELRSAAYGIVAKLEQLQDVGRLGRRYKMVDELAEIIDPRIQDRRLLEERQALAKSEKEMEAKEAKATKKAPITINIISELDGKEIVRKVIKLTPEILARLELD